MDLTNSQLLTHLRDVEVLAEDVLADKQVSITKLCSESKKNTPLKRSRYTSGKANGSKFGYRSLLLYTLYQP